MFEADLGAIQNDQFREWISPATLLFLLNDLLRWATLIYVIHGCTRNTRRKYKKEIQEGARSKQWYIGPVWCLHPAPRQSWWVKWPSQSLSKIKYPFGWWDDQWWRLEICRYEFSQTSRRMWRKNRSPCPSWSRCWSAPPGSPRWQFSGPYLAINWKTLAQR